MVIKTKTDQLLVDVKQIRTDVTASTKAFKSALKKANALGTKLEAIEKQLAVALTELTAAQKKAAQSLQAADKLLKAPAKKAPAPVTVKGKVALDNKLPAKTKAAAKN